MMTREQVRAIVRAEVQALGKGSFVKSDKNKGELEALAPAGGTHDHFTIAYPFGMVAKPAKRTVAYFLNLFGFKQRSVVLNHLHENRPVPSAQGEVILYSTNAAGETFPIKITMGADGVLEIRADTKVRVLCDNIEIGNGSLEKLFLCETFQQRFNNHKHIGNAGVETSVPIEPSPASDLSNVVKNS